MPDPRYQGWKRDTSKLKPYQAKWKSGQTKSIRVPIKLVDQILDFARSLDNGDRPDYPQSDRLEDSDIRDTLTAILARVEAKEGGYRANSACGLIKALKHLIASPISSTDGQKDP